LALAYGAGGLWVLGQPRGQRTYTLTLVDPTTNRVARHLSLPAEGTGDITNDRVAMAVSPTAIWVTVAAGGPRVLRVNPKTGGLDATVTLDAQVGTVATGAHGVFLGLLDGTVAGLDPSTGRISGRVRVSEGTGAGVVDGGSAL
jgi:virginiamycin B lyase